MNSCVCRCDPAYWIVPRIDRPRTFPATRTTKSSPKPQSKTSSGGTRLSLQPRIVAKGCCFFASVARISFCTVGNRARPRANRAFPSLRRFSAAVADTECMSVHAGAHVDQQLIDRVDAHESGPRIFDLEDHVDRQRDDGGEAESMDRIDLVRRLIAGEQGRYEGKPDQ